MDLKTFLLARIAEDEAEANGQLGAEYYTDGAWPEEVAARVLAECAAKRAIIFGAKPFACADMHDESLRALAAVYADHPDYQPEWAQEASQA